MTARGNIETWEQAGIAVLMDLRDELKELVRTNREIDNSLRALRCRNFLRIPAKLDRIGRNTEKKRKLKGT